MSSVILLIRGIVKVDQEFCNSVKSGRDAEKREKRKKKARLNRFLRCKFQIDNEQLYPRHTVSPKFIFSFF